MPASDYSLSQKAYALTDFPLSRGSASEKVTPTEGKDEGTKLIITTSSINHRKEEEKNATTPGKWGGRKVLLFASKTFFSPMRVQNPRVLQGLPFRKK